MFTKIYNYLDIDTFSKLKDYDYEDKMISYAEYFKKREIVCSKNTNNIFTLELKSKRIPISKIFYFKYYTLFIYLVNMYYEEYPLNVLSKYNWPKYYINMAFNTKKFYYLHYNGTKNVKIRSLKSAINTYNMHAITKILLLGVQATKSDLKVASFIKIKQIKDLIVYDIYHNMNIFDCVDIDTLPRHMIKNMTKGKYFYVKSKREWFYDGDTLDVCIKINAEIYRESLRLYGYDSDEIRGGNLEMKERGLKAKKCLQELIDGKILILHGMGSDKYGRLLGKLYIFDSKENNIKFYIDSIEKKRDNYISTETEMIKRGHIKKN